MNNKIFKYNKILGLVLLGIGVAALVYFLIAALTQTQSSTEPGFTGWSAGTVSGANVMLICTYILFALAAIVALIFPLITIIRNPKGSMRSLIGILAMVVVLGVSYLFSSSTPIVTPVDTFDKVGERRLADTGPVSY